MINESQRVALVGQVIATAIVIWVGVIRDIPPLLTFIAINVIGVAAMITQNKLEGKP